jgi:hypothetical protein
VTGGWFACCAPPLRCLEPVVHCVAHHVR